MDPSLTLSKKTFSLPVLFVLGRLVIFLGSTLDGFRGYGDFIHFFHLASLPGWPFIHYWVEFPPVFPFLSTILFFLSAGQEHTFDYLLAFLLTAADTLALLAFMRLEKRVDPLRQGGILAWVYMVTMLCLPYYWWYFDSLALCALLWGLVFLLEGQKIKGGLALAVGFLVKFFPAIGLAVQWRKASIKEWLYPMLVVLIAFLLVYGLLDFISPQFTFASVISQGNKGSWETVWALIDGNGQTGNFGPEIERLDLRTAAIPRGNPPRVSSLATLAFFGGIGFLGLFFSHPADERQQLALAGFTWCLMILWSPGWSPQWVLYILPFILLVFPLQTGSLLLSVMVLVNLMEWPVLLSRGLFNLLPLPVLLRTFLTAFLSWLFIREVRHIALVDVWPAIFKNRN